MTVPDLVAWIVGAYALFVAVSGGLAVVRQHERAASLDQFSWMLAFLSFILVLVSLGTLGAHPSSTHVGYLGAAAVVMPFAIVSVRHDRGAWTSGVLAVSAVAVGVVAWRVIVTS